MNAKEEIKAMGMAMADINMLTNNET